MLVIVGLPIIALDRLLRDLALDRDDRCRRSARVSHRARARPVGPRRSGAGRLHASVVHVRLQPGGHRRTATGFSLAIVFTVQGLTGWEAAVPLAEETENPRRNVPRATMASIVIVGVMLVLVIWGQVIGWGTNNLSKLAALRGAPGAGDRAPRAGASSVVARAARDVHVGDRREPRLPERRHPHVVRDGPKRRRCPSAFGRGPPARGRRRPPRSRRSSSCRWCSGCGLAQWLGPAEHVHPVRSGSCS